MAKKTKERVICEESKVMNGWLPCFESLTLVPLESNQVMRHANITHHVGTTLGVCQQSTIMIVNSFVDIYTIKETQVIFGRFSLS
jgi:hypothetical protein